MLSGLRFLGTENGSNYTIFDSLKFGFDFISNFQKTEKNFQNCQNWFIKYFHQEKNSSANNLISTKANNQVADLSAVFLKKTSKNLNKIISNSALSTQNLSNHYIFFGSSARGCLYLLLKSLDLPKETQVISQVFSCGVVINAINKAGLTPILCDINNDYNLDLDFAEKLITKNTKILIIQHTFGVMPNMSKVLNFCQKHNLLLIEDCAHSLGSSFEQRLAGNFGHAAIFSFGRDKVVSTVTGGLGVIHKNKDFPYWLDFNIWQKNLGNMYSQSQNYPTKLLLKDIFYILSVPFLTKVYHIFGKYLIWFFNKFNFYNQVYTNKEKQGLDLSDFVFYKFPKSLSSILLYQLNKFEQVKKHRLKIAQIYATKLGQKYDQNANYIRFPVLAKNSDSFFKIKKLLIK